MESGAFKEPNSGHLVPVARETLIIPRPTEGLIAFVPAPLPPQLGSDKLNTRELEAAALALGGLRHIGLRLPNPMLLVRPLLSREAIFSSRIEGTVASAEDLALFEADPTSARSRPSVVEVWNYLSAVERGLERIRSAPDEPIGLDLIADLHRRLMTGARRSRERAPGEFRHVQNWIGPAGTTIENARYVPPPPIEMFASLEAFERYLNSTHEHPALVRVALAHYQFEAIHPFVDGNGRVGRILVILLMARWGLLTRPLLHLSAYFERNFNGYVDRMLGVSQRGEWAEWISFFLQGVAEEADAGVARAGALLDLRERYRERMREITASPNAPALVDWLFTRPVITIPDAADHLNVTYPPAQDLIERLVAADILVERTGNRPRIFSAHELLAVVGSG